MRYGFEECSLLLPLCVEMMTEVEELQRAARDWKEKGTDRKSMPPDQEKLFSGAVLRDEVTWL